MCFSDALRLLPLLSLAASPRHAKSPQNAETGMTDGGRKLMFFVRVDVVSVSPPAK